MRQPPAEGEHATSHACLLCGRRAAQDDGGAIYAYGSSHVTVAGQSTLSGNRAEVYAAGLGVVPGYRSAAAARYAPQRATTWNQATLSLTSDAIGWLYTILVTFWGEGCDLG